MARLIYKTADIEKIARVMRARTAAVEGLLKQMKDHEFEGSLYIDGGKELLRGLEYLEKWTAYASAEFGIALPDPELYDERIPKGAEMAPEHQASKRRGPPRPARSKR